MDGASGSGAEADTEQDKTKLVDDVYRKRLFIIYLLPKAEKQDIQRLVDWTVLSEERMTV